jgi:glutamate 5-kinase
MGDYKRIVIKIGSNVLAASNGGLDNEIIKELVTQISILKKQNIELIVVSSGAVASGRSLLKLSEKIDDITARQVLASVGQVKLLHTYYEMFSKEEIACSQVLVTKEDFRDRTHYFNMKNCFEALIQNSIIPIVNENDVISITELMFTDNDELAGLIATMVNADALFILSNVDGIFTGDPKNPESKIIHLINDKSTDLTGYIQHTKSEFGRGGMITKGNMARKVAKAGITVKIANGKIKGNLIKLVGDKKNTIGTTFLPVRQATSVKKRIAFSESFTKGKIVVNDGAKTALFSDKATSLLTVGVVNIEGEFQTGDVVGIGDLQGNIIGMGKVQFNSEKAKELIGQKGQKPLIHYDYLYLK